MHLRWNAIAISRTTNSLSMETLRAIPMKMLWKRIPVSSMTHCIISLRIFSSRCFCSSVVCRSSSWRSIRDRLRPILDDLPAKGPIVPRGPVVSVGATGSPRTPSPLASGCRPWRDGWSIISTSISIKIAAKAMAPGIAVYVSVQNSGRHESPSRVKAVGSRWTKAVAMSTPVPK